jgi:hypothetical protein
MKKSHWALLGGAGAVLLYLTRNTKNPGEVKITKGEGYHIVGLLTPAGADAAFLGGLDEQGAINIESVPYQKRSNTTLVQYDITARADAVITLGKPVPNELGGTFTVLDVLGKGVRRVYENY